MSSSESSRRVGEEKAKDSNKKGQEETSRTLYSPVNMWNTSPKPQRPAPSSNEASIAKYPFGKGCP